jgi:hypothetical protein
MTLKFIDVKETMNLVLDIQKQVSLFKVVSRTLNSIDICSQTTCPSLMVREKKNSIHVKKKLNNAPILTF